MRGRILSTTPDAVDTVKSDVTPTDFNGTTSAGTRPSHRRNIFLALERTRVVITSEQGTVANSSLAGIPAGERQLNALFSQTQVM